MIASGWRLMTRRPAGSRLMQRRTRASPGAAVALVVAATPFIRAMRRSGVEGRRLDVAVVATAVAGIWSLVSGTIVVMSLTALAVPAG